MEFHFDILTLFGFSDYLFGFVGTKSLEPEEYKFRVYQVLTSSNTNTQGWQPIWSLASKFSTLIKVSVLILFEQNARTGAGYWGIAAAVQNFIQSLNCLMQNPCFCASD